MKIEAKIEKEINYVAAHAGIQKLVSDIKITDLPTKELILRITAEPEFIFESKLALDGKSTSYEAKEVEILFNDAFYRSNIIEAVDTMVKLEVYDSNDPDVILGFLHQKVHVQAYLHWNNMLPETTPGFMQPNDPLVQRVLQKAGEYAKEMGILMCGYQETDEENIKKQAECIYKALVDMKIHYYNPPASFELRGQKIRLPHQVLHEESKQGTCLDLAVLFATCLESLGLNAGVVLIRGHAFAGYWSRDIYMNKVVCYVKKAEDLQPLLKALTEFVPVECTLFREDGADFAYALKSGKEKMNRLEEFVDVARARKNGIMPVYTFTDKPICETETFSEKEFLTQEFTKTNKTQLDALKEQAVDITAHNRLLNCDADKLFIPLNITAKDFLERGFTDAELAKINETFMKKYSEVLRQLYTKNRRGKKENGKSSVYLAVNELRLQSDKNSGEKHYNAVLYLCPAEIYRNGRGDYMLRVDSDKVFFNPALRILLEQGYQLDSRRLMDQPKDEYENQMKLLSFLIEHQKGWSIKENVARLSLFTISDEAIVNALNEPTLVKHEIVRGILDGEMSWNNEIVDETNMKDSDESSNKKRSNSFIKPRILAADGSQEAIIKNAFSQKASLVVGPAGNGKTQTIDNIGFKAIEEGKSIMIVAEKKTAQDVVNTRLNEGTGGFSSLLIRSGLSDKEVIDQVKNALEYHEQARRDYRNRSLDDIKKQYEEGQKFIEAYYDLMTQVLACGKTLEELVDMYAEVDSCPINLSLDEKMLAQSYLELTQQISLYLSVLDASERAMGNYSDYIRYDNLRGTAEQETYNLAKTAVDKFQQMETSFNAYAETVFGKKINELNKKDMKKVIVAASVLSKCDVYHKSANEIFETAGKVDNEYKNQLVAKFTDYANSLEDNLRRNPRRILPRFGAVHRTACENHLRHVFGVNEVRDLMDLFDKEPKTFWDKISKMKFVFDENGKTVLDGSNRTVNVVKNYFDTLRNTCKKFDFTANETKQVEAAANAIIAGKATALKNQSLKLVDLHNDYERAQKEALSMIVRNEEEFDKQYPDVFKKVLIEEWLEYRNNDFNRSRSAYDRTINEMEAEGLMPLVKQIKSLKDTANVTNEDIEDAVQKAWIDGQINSVLKEHLDSNNFDNFKFQNKVKYLYKNETIIRENLKNEIMNKVLERMPNLEQGISNNKEFGVLQKLVRQKNTTIRMLFEQTPNVLKQLFPCMIMDPVAVAKYVPADFPKFDLVIIDEGSQMPTYEAIIPISRAKACMIFGDEKQLQVMDEFKKKVVDEDDNLLGRESILTSAYITSMPRNMLRFHYRSENESLVAFSNKQYYHNAIVTFPSCDTAVNGVSYEFVKGVYEKNGCKGNREEAAAVIKKIREVFQNNNDISSIGVITLNVHQRDLISHMLMNETRNDSELGKLVDDNVDVINLEACQGQEWDMVIIAPGFGNDEKGQFNMGFGALNKADGVNRLNVMLTRAKKKMVVITSIEPHMLANAKSEGVKDFREFLKFAKGDIKLDNRVYNREERVPGIVNSVASALEAKGYEVHTDIGSSDFKVDIGVVSKKNKEQYSLGIILDHFDDAKNSIHDREITYVKSLENKGWNIYRLRYLNWKEDAQTEVCQILKMLEE